MKLQLIVSAAEVSWDHPMGIDKRKERRRQIYQPALMINERGAVIGPCRILDVSAGGARLALNAEVDVPATFLILLSKYRGAPKRQCILSWKKGMQVGIRFQEHGKPPPSNP